MAQKLFSSEEAAKFLGVTVDKLNEMRERRQVFGIRDGANWKYKEQDLERAAEDLRGGGSGIGLGGIDDQETDSVLLSEVELGEGASATMPGTVIGKPGTLSAIDSDLEIFDMDDKRASGSSATSDSDVELVPDLKASAMDSDVKLVPKDDGSAVGSDLGSALELSDLSLDDDDTDLPFDLGSSLGSSAILDSKVKKQFEKIKPDSGVGSDLTLDVEDASSSIAFDSGLSLASEPGADAPSSSSASGIDSAIELGGSAFEDDDLVLGSQSGGSDINDSGISLASPADSGLSLEQPLELGDDADEGSGTTGELMADDEFLLTPAVEMGEEDLDESGSQVIALDTEGDFDDSAATMLGGDAAGIGMLEEDPLGAQSLDMTQGTIMPTPMTTTPVIAREAPYSIFNVLSLATCALFLMLTGMFMFDLMRNMWSWDGPYTFNSTMMDSIIGMFEK